MLLTLRLSRTAWILIFSRSAGSTVKVNLSFGMIRQYAYTCYRVNAFPAHFLHVLSQSPCPLGLAARPLGWESNASHLRDGHAVLDFEMPALPLVELRPDALRILDNLPAVFDVS